MPHQATTFDALVLPHADVACNLVPGLALDPTAADVHRAGSGTTVLVLPRQATGDAKLWLLHIARDMAYVRAVSRRRIDAPRRRLLIYAVPATAVGAGEMP